MAQGGDRDAACVPCSLRSPLLTCCSSVITVCTRKLPLSHGSVMPTEPGRNSPAARICRQRLHEGHFGLKMDHSGKKHRREVPAGRAGFVSQWSP